MYDFRTNVHFTLKQHPMTDAGLEDFICCFNPENRHQRHETWAENNPDGRWRKFTCFLVPHCVPATWRSRAQTNMSAELPSGKQPTTRVRQRTR